MVPIEWRLWNWTAKQSISFPASIKMTDLIKFSPVLIRWHIFLGVNLLQDQRFKEAFHAPLTSTVESPNSKATLPRLHTKELDTVQHFSTFGNKLENPSGDARRSSIHHSWCGTYHISSWCDSRSRCRSLNSRKEIIKVEQARREDKI